MGECCKKTEKRVDAVVIVLMECGGLAFVRADAIHAVVIDKDGEVNVKIGDSFKDSSVHKLKPGSEEDLIFDWSKGLRDLGLAGFNDACPASPPAACPEAERLARDEILR